MVLPSSWSVVVALVLAAPGAVSEDDGEAIGIVWHQEATGPSTIRQRLAEAVAQSGMGDVEPRTVIDSADQRARVSVAVALPREQAETVVRLAQALSDATTRFREGDLPGAEAGIGDVLAALQADPLLPGAAALSFSAQVLRAQVAWTTGDVDLARAAMGLAVALDPDVELSTRRVPPAIAALYAEIRQQVTASRDTWPSIAVAADPSVQPIVVEIDGRAGQQRVPAGDHFVVVRRPGRAPLAFFVPAGDTGATIVVPDQPERIASGLPADRQAAEAICEHSEAVRLVLAQTRAGRLALEGYVCGAGFGPTWFSEPYAEVGAPTDPLGPSDPALLAGVRRATGSLDVYASRSRLAAQGPWPAPRKRVAPAGTDDGTAGPIAVAPAKPWYRRAWIWSVIGGVVVAGVTTGAVLGTRQQPSEVTIDADTFLRP